MNVENKIVEMVEAGASLDYIKEVIAQMEEERKRNEETAKITEAREEFVAALEKYMAVTGTPMDEEDKKEFLNQLIQAEKFAERMSRYVENMLGNLKIQGKYPVPNGVTLVSTDTKLDEDVLRKFLEREI